mgnify:CR=1 FL=1
MAFERPSEFPSKEEQLKNLTEQESQVRKSLRDLGLKDDDIDKLILNPQKINDLSFIPDEYISDVKRLIEELIGIKRRKDFLEKGENDLPQTPPEFE